MKIIKMICLILLLFGNYSVKAAKNPMSGLAYPGSITGKISDSESQKPLGGILVKMEEGQDITGKNGIFSIGGLRPGTHIIQISGKNYMPLLMTVTVGNGKSQRDFQLVPARNTVSLSGIITDSVTEDPIFGAMVMVDNQIARCERDGSFNFPSIDYGEHIISIKADNYMVISKKIVVDGTKSAFNMALEPKTQPFWVSGNIKDDETGIFIRGAQVKIADRAAVTNSKGDFVIKGILPGNHKMEIRAFGYNTCIEDIQVGNGPQSVNTTLSRIRKKGTITGRILSADGSPVSGVRIYSGENQALSDAKGEYRLLNIPEGAQKLVAEKDGYERYENPVLVAPTQQDIGINLQKIRETGDMVFLFKDRETGHYLTLGDLEFAGTSRPFGGDGKLLLREIPLGSYPIQVKSPNYMPVVSTVLCERGRQIITISMEKKGSIDGFLAADSGNRDGIISVNTAKSMGNERIFADLDNLVALSNIPEKEGQGPNFAPSGSEYGYGPSFAPSSNAAGYGPNFGHVQGILTMAGTKKPVASAIVMVGNRMAETDDLGFYTIKFLSMGDHEILAWHDNLGLYSGQISLVDQVLNFNMELTQREQKSSLFGTVTVSSTGDAVIGAVVKVGKYKAITDKEGKYLIDKLDGDYYKVNISARALSPFDGVVFVHDGPQRRDFFLEETKKASK